MIKRFYDSIRRRYYSFVEQHLYTKPASEIKKETLLILRLDSIGDYVLFRNFIAVLKKSEKYKKYSITFCGNSWIKDLAENLDASDVDSFIWVDYSKLTDFTYRHSVYKEIHEKGFEVVLHPSFSRDTISDGIVTHSGAPIKIGYNGDCSNLTDVQKKKNDAVYTQLVTSYEKYQFEFYRNENFFEQILNEKINLKRPEIKYPVRIENKIIICPGAKDDFRRWSASSFHQLCLQLQTQFPGHTFSICGSVQDQTIAQEIKKFNQIDYADLTGKLTLMGLIETLSQAKLIITNDSGPFHISVALGKKVVCLSNGNNYGRFSPYPKEMETDSCVLYPSHVLELNEEDRLEKFCREVKNSDINVIKPAMVFDQIQKMFNCESCQL